MNRPGRTVLVALLVAALALAGCAEPYDPCRGSGSPHNLDLVVERGLIRDDTVIHTFTCETENAAYPIDRYTFWLAFPRTNIIEIEPEPLQHADGSGRPIVQRVAEGLHHRWHPASDPADDAPSYRVTWKGWDPDHRGDERTTVELEWVDDTGTAQALPAGLYGIRVGLRDEHDRTAWRVVEHVAST